MKTLMKIGDFLYLDALDIAQCEEGSNSEDTDDSQEDSCEQSESFHIESCVERHYSAYGFNWPYLMATGMPENTCRRATTTGRLRLPRGHTSILFMNCNSITNGTAVSMRTARVQ